MSNPYNLKVGQELWFVSPYAHRPNQHVAIKSVGCKWAQLDWHSEIRVNLETLKGDIPNYSSRHGRFYLTKEEWENERALRTAWDRFQADIRQVSALPASATVASIDEARRLLGLTADA